MKEFKAFLASLFAGFMDWLTSPAGKAAFWVFVRSMAKVVSGVLVAKGWIADGGGFESIFIGAAIFVGSEAFSQWSKFKDRQKMATAQASNQKLTESEIDALIADPKVPTPSVTTPKDEVPQLVLKV